MPRVLITGASSGIGAALAKAYAAQGAELCLLGRDAARLQALATTIQAAYPDVRVLTHCQDVGDGAAMLRWGARLLETWGTPDIVIASAGVSAGTLTEETDDFAVFERIMASNVLGMVATFTPFVAAMRARGAGRLVGIASVAGVRGLPGAGAYSASKAAVIRYLESLRLELRGSGVQVVTLAPGYIDTPMTRVNPYRMPFLMPVDAAAACFVRWIAAGRSYGVAPWPMAWVARLLAILPNAVYDRLFAQAPRKPRMTKVDVNKDE